MLLKYRGIIHIVVLHSQHTQLLLVLGIVVMIFSPH